MTRRMPRSVLLLAAGGLAVAGCGSGSDEAAPVDAAPADDPPATGPPAATMAPVPPTTVAAPEPIPPTTVAAPEPIPPDPPPGMELVWSDEFDGDVIDRTNWTYDIGGWGWGNGEAQHYTDRPENARTENGLLVIELRQEQFEESYYTSARLTTKGRREFRYGRIEARVKVPKGAGTWPAFWMLGSNFVADSDDPAEQWPNVGEIDIMEHVGREPDLVIGTVHGPGYAGSAGISQWNRQDVEIGDEFHTFAVEWSADGLRWFFDDDMYFDIGPERVGRREWVFDQPFFIILNLAIGGTLGGTIATDLQFPIRYYVDHVRVYQPIADRADS